jgi:ParB/RepB/Spo0J family partition protein
MTTQIIDINVSDIRRSPHNHRKTFTGLEELAESIRTKGLINPITVRQTGDTDLRKPGYELVAGERRWRAAKMAKLASIPAIVRQLDDKEVLELQLVENVQRADVHPLEEADGYEELIAKHGYEVDSIAAKIGKSKAYVYARLKLASLGEYAREKFLAGELSASIALLIARIPDVQLQERATKDVLGETDFDAVAEDDSPLGNALEDDLHNPASPLNEQRRTIAVDDEAADGGLDATNLAPNQRERLPMSVREAQIHLRRRYMLRLELATFEVADPQLVPTAGACTTCQYRTGTQPELFADVTAADVCTNPPCFERKTTAAWELKKASAEHNGVKVVEAADAAKVFTPSAQVRPTSPYVDPDAPVPLDLMPAGTKKAPTWGKLLGKKVGTDDAPFVLVQDHTGAGHELIDKRTAVETLRELGKIDKPLKPAKSTASSSSGKDPYKEQAEKEQKKREQWTRAARAALEDAWSKSKKLDLKDPEWWSWVIASILDVTSINEVLGGGDTAQLWETARTLEDYTRLLTALVLAEAAQLPTHANGLVYHDPAKAKQLQAGLALLGVSYEDHLERIKASDKEAAKAEAKLAKEQAKKGGKK